MIILTIVLFALAAVFGVILITKLLSKKPLNKPVVYTHGLLAATALVLLIIYSIQNDGNYPRLSVIIFVVAAIGGFVLFINDYRKKPGPAYLAFIHGLAAVIAFVLLIVFALS